jgi:hypothetical protein
VHSEANLTKPKNDAYPGLVVWGRKGCATGNVRGRRGADDGDNSICTRIKNTKSIFFLQGIAMLGKERWDGLFLLVLILIRVVELKSGWYGGWRGWAKNATKSIRRILEIGSWMHTLLLIALVSEKEKIFYRAPPICFMIAFIVELK